MVTITIPTQPITTTLDRFSYFFNEQRPELAQTLRAMTPWEVVQVHAVVVDELVRRGMCTVTVN